MSMDHRDRDELYRRLSELFGEELAAKFLESLPPMDWTQLATKDDIADLRAAIERCATKEELHREITTLGTELRGEMAALGTELRGEVAALRAELSGGLGEIRGEFKGLRDLLGAEREAMGNEVLATVRGDLAAAIASQTRSVILGMAGTAATVGGVVVAAVRLA